MCFLNISGWAEHPTDSAKTPTTSQNQLNYLQQLAKYRTPLTAKNNRQALYTIHTLPQIKKYRSFLQWDQVLEEQGSFSKSFDLMAAEFDEADLDNYVANNPQVDTLLAKAIRTV
ncbi:hypothetical protein [Croceiramulus getboli]|nr:hypothetical protein P8624_06575 [Flavobacteriaceae bacterium YJPT1-3]